MRFVLTVLAIVLAVILNVSVNVQGLQIQAQASNQDVWNPIPISYFGGSYFSYNWQWPWTAGTTVSFPFTLAAANIPATATSILVHVEGDTGSCSAQVSTELTFSVSATDGTTYAHYMYVPTSTSNAIVYFNQDWWFPMGSNIIQSFDVKSSATWNCATSNTYGMSFALIGYR